MTGGGGRGKAQRIEPAEQVPPGRVVAQLAALDVVGLGGQFIASAVSRSVVPSADRTLAASTCWAALTPGAVDRACATAAANTAAISRAASACHVRPATGPGGAPGALALGGGRGIPGVEVFGQQRAQQRRQRDQRRPPRRRALRPASGS